MKLITDFHIHSRYSRATSKAITIENIAQGALEKGIDIIATGDCTHPLWMKEIKDKLEPAERGLYKLKENDRGVRFIIGGEISCIYKKGDKCRKNHINIIFSGIEACENFNAELNTIGNIHSDGRPILGMDVIDLLKLHLKHDPDGLFIPAHCMTPWFSIFGSKSGFDSVEECFGEYSKYIYALETGLSADPSMLWSTPDGRRLTLLSNSDAHSLKKFGREATVFDCNKDYYDIRDAIVKKDKKRILYTIEFFPQEGKYYHDGHLKCGINWTPEQTRKNKGICPVCGQKLVVGVLNRIQDISDEPLGHMPKDAIPFKSIVPLPELIAYAFSCGVTAKKVDIEYAKLIKELGAEFKILLDIELSDIQKVAKPEVFQVIKMMREGKIMMEPGFDGQYGKLITGEIKKSKQESLI